MSLDVAVAKGYAELVVVVAAGLKSGMVSAGETRP